MKILELTNNTHYFKKDLEKLLTLVFQEYKRNDYKKIFARYQYDTIRVFCKYRKVAGWNTSYQQNFIVLKLPKLRVNENNETFEQNIVRAFLHELDYCCGVPQYSKPRDSDRKLQVNALNEILGASFKISKHDMNRDISYLPADLIVREKGSTVKKKTPDLKVTVLLERKKKWESRMKRCKNALTKIERKIKYYEKKKNTETV